LTEDINFHPFEFAQTAQFLVNQGEIFSTTRDATSVPFGIWQLAATLALLTVVSLNLFLEFLAHFLELIRLSTSDNRLLLLASWMIANCTL
jgi:uncharacterized membrane protein